MKANKYKVFISSVQSEFEKEREVLLDYISTDVLLKSFFQPYIFEKNSATSSTPQQVYSKEIKKSDIYIGLLGKLYGYEDKSGISPTETEYDLAKSKALPRWIYILKTSEKRHEKEERFIQKVSNDVSWKFFTDIENLKKEVYNSCVEFLKQKGKIENNDFDNSLHPYATIDDIDDNILKEFIGIAREKRNFTEKVNAPKIDVLNRLNLIRDGKIVNSALLLFSKNPQQFFPTATVKCAHFHGDIVQKPIPDYKEFTGTIFEMADLAVDFILSKISLSTGTRENTNLVETEYEIPRSAIAEAVINSLAHRDYFSKASTQISVFKNRIEIENPGRLPIEITIEDLIKTHASYPHNPLLANCLFLVGAIERYGTGIVEMIQNIEDKGLPIPSFKSTQTFKVILWRKEINQKREQVKEQVREQVEFEIDEKIINIVIALNGHLSASEIMEILSLKGRRNFIENYLHPALNKGFIEMMQPENPNSPIQKYRLTNKGTQLQKQLIKAPNKQLKVAEKEDFTPKAFRSIFGVNAVEMRSKYGENIYKTLILIWQEPDITSQKIATELNLSKRTIENYLAKLKADAIIERKGSDKTGKWIILKKEN